MATQATPANNHQQVPPANHPPAPVPVNQDEEMDDADSSDDEEVEQLRVQITAMSAEMDGLRELIERMGETQREQNAQYMDNVQNVNNMATAAMRGKDVGEILKPDPPEKFDGTAYKLPTFLTQLRAFMTYYPTQFNLASSKVQYAAGRLTKHAAAWFEPVMKEYLTTPFVELSPRTANLYSNFETFEAALQQAFGTVDERAQAEREIKALRQTRSASEYGTKYLQLASKLNWNQEPLMSLFFDGLKKEVQSELYKEERPNDLVDYIGRAVKIDDQQFSWKKLQNPRFGSNKANNPRFDANQGKKRQNNTSYGTNPGPMELGAAQQGPKDIECYYCHKKGHKANECRKKQRDIKEGRYQPRPRQPLPEGKKHLNATNQDSDPQTAIRTTRTLGMAREGYDKTGLRPGEVTMPHARAYLTKEQAEHNINIGQSCADRLHKAERPEKPETVHLTIPAVWKPLPEPANGGTKPDNAKIIAVTRRNQHHEPINRSQYSEGTRVQRELDAIRTRRQQRHTTLWEDNYEILVKEETGERYWLSSNAQHIQLARERQNVDDAEDIHVRAYHEEQAMNPRQPELRLDLRDDPRTMSTHPRHEEISWVSCKDHRCSMHIADKRKNDCFPVQLRQPNTRPYLAYETFQYRIQEWYEGIGVATLRFYPTKEGAVSLERWFTIATWRTMTEQGNKPDGSCPNAEATLCCEETCPRHGQQVLATHERIERMAKEGFNFLTHQGRKEDKEWYEGIRPYLRKDHGPTDKVLQEYADYIRRGDLDKVHPETSQQPECDYQDEGDRMAEESYWQWQDSMKDDHDYEACADSECEYDHLSHALAMSKN